MGMTTPPRLVSVDTFRGATVAAMLLVTNPGTWSAIYPPLRHAEWHGWTPTDLIFPFFLFVVGITTDLSRKEPLKIVRRGLLIVLLGLLVNGFPYFRLDTLRWSGVLQRIGVVYMAAALLARFCSRRVLFGVAAAILLGYWAILAQGPLQPPEATIAARIDRAVLGPDHIWKAARTWDPEGPLSTMPAVATALFGVLAAPWVRERNVKMLTFAGAAGIAAGWAWGLLFPINKNIWTSSYVLFTAGWAAVILAACIWIVDLRGVRGWTKPFVIFGVNPLVAFVGSGMMARLLGIIRVDGAPLQAWSYRTFFGPFFEPKVASLLWALAFVGIWLAILAILYRRKIVLRV